MENLEKRIADIANEIIGFDQKLFLVDVIVKGNVGNQKVLVLIDGDEGVNIDDCSKISREIGPILEEGDFMPGKYLLEVSSPGLDHPIRLMRQYKKNVGRKVEVETLEGEKIKGEIVIVENETITLKMEKEVRNIRFSEINQSKIEVSFK
ncbi:MAG: ribosome maturation factor RimP [Cyclobacteriaceae bacterium]